MNRKISIKSIVATIIFLSISVILGMSIHFHGWKADTPIFWFLAVLLIGNLICVLVCLSNIDKRINLYTKVTDEEDSENINLTTCPNYWTKHIVFDEFKKPVTMCFNMMNDKFIDHPLTQVDSSYSFSPNSMYSGSNISDLRAMRKLPYDDIEGFSTGDLQNEQGLNNEDEYKYRHSHYTKLVAEPSEGTDYIGPHEHDYDTGRRWHSHHVNFNDNNLPGGSDKFEYKVTDANFLNWINPFVHDKVTRGRAALEINLNQLNSSTNVCQLVKKIPWSEANAKCKDIKS
jgi:hypothetical protein